MSNRMKQVFTNLRQTVFVLFLILCASFITLSPSKAYAWCADAVVNCTDNCWAQTGGTGVLPETTAYCASHGGVAPFNCTGDIGNYCPDRPVVNASCSTASINQCNAGTLFDLTDTTTDYVWRCDGIGGGSSVTCGRTKPTPGWTSKGCGGSIVASFACNAEEDDRTCADNERLEYQVYTTNCPARTGWQTTRTRCIADSSCTVAANAVCGTANGQSLAAAPSTAAALCSVGASTPVTGGASGPWSWNCSGINGGTNANCSAVFCPPPVDGVCNNSFNNICQSGTLFDLADNSTDYLWRCDGQNGGSNATCSMPKTPVIVDPPGCIPTGQPVPAGQTACPTNACFLSVSGAAVNPDAASPYYYKKADQNDGTGLIGGLVGEGSYSPASPYTGYAGRGDFRDCVFSEYINFCFITPDVQYPLKAADARTFDSMVIGDKTRVVIYKNTGYAGGKFLDIHGPAVIFNKLWRSGIGNTTAEKNDTRWNSEGYGGYTFWSDDAPVRIAGNTVNTNNDLTDDTNMQRWGRDTSIQVICDPVPVDGVCNNSVNNVCSAGTSRDTTDNSSNYLWYCDGMNGGSTASCSMAKPVQVNGQCNNSNQNGCSAGTFSDRTDDASNYLWSCNGINGGANDNCVMPIPPAPVAGVCNNGTRNACSAGTSASQGEDATNYTWNCNGLNGGANASCAIAKPPSGPACAGNILYSKQSFCADGKCEGYGYSPYSVDYSPSWIINGNVYFSDNNVDPALVNANPTTSKFVFPASNYYSTGAPNPPPFTQTTDYTYKVSVTVGGVTRDLDFTVPRASRLTPVWAPSSGAWYEGPYTRTETVNGATCSLMSTLGHWASIGGIYSKHQSAQISCSCEGRPMTPPPVCGPAGLNPNGFNTATEVNNAGLCGKGGMSANVSGNGAWNWTCSSPNSGASVNCSTPKCVPSSETTVTCDGNGYDAVYDNCGTRKRIIANPACDFDPWNPI